MNNMSIDFTLMEDSVKSHMESQPYEMKCSECGALLTADETDLDNDLDLYIKVAPCQTCLDDAVEDAKKEMESNNE
jgi:hypothetical protein